MMKKTDSQKKMAAYERAGKKLSKAFDVLDATPERAAYEMARARLQRLFYALTKRELNVLRKRNVRYPYGMT